MAMTNAQKQRQMRQDALREQLKGSGLITQYIDVIKKIDELDPSDEEFNNKLSKLKLSNENRAKLINKVLPDEKFVEISGELSLPQVITKDLSGEGD